MVRFEVVYLFSEEQDPEIFADEFYAVEGGEGAGFVGGETGGWGLVWRGRWRGEEGLGWGEGGGVGRGEEVLGEGGGEGRGEEGRDWHTVLQVLVLHDSLDYLISRISLRGSFHLVYHVFLFLLL